MWVVGGGVKRDVDVQGSEGKGCTKLLAEG